VNVVEGPPDLIEACEDVAGLLAEWARALADVEIVGQIATEPLEKRDPTARCRSPAEPRKQRALMALVERIEDEVLVRSEFLGPGSGSTDEAIAGRVGEGRRAGRDLDDVRCGLGFIGGVPEGPGGIEGVAERCPLDL
jgi:hypothetical protein